MRNGSSATVSNRGEFGSEPISDFVYVGTTNHIASLNNMNNRGLDVTDDEHRCKHISSQLLAAKPLTLKSTRCTTF